MLDNGSFVTLRPFTMRDIPALVSLRNAHFPDEPLTVEEREYQEQQRDPARPFLQLVAELDGKMVGYGYCGLSYGGSVRYSFWVMVDRDYLGRGIGRRIAADLETWAREAGQPLIRANCRDDHPRSVSFLMAAGFQQIGQRFESVLYVDDFDEQPFVHVFDQVAQAGITLTTFDRETAPDAEERLYQLAHPLLLSIPFPGGEQFDMPFEDWKSETFEHPSASREATVVAKRGDRYIGYSSVWLPKDGPPGTIMTGVDPAERRNGVALALKLMTIRIVRGRGYHEMRTTNDTTNPGILALNQRLGYQPLPAWLAWEKPLNDA